jgi:hypothetical protein
MLVNESPTIATAEQIEQPASKIGVGSVDSPFLIDSE